jgi:hypothetical protein
VSCYEYVTNHGRNAETGVGPAAQLVDGLLLDLARRHEQKTPSFQVHRHSHGLI